MFLQHRLSQHSRYVYISPSPAAFSEPLSSCSSHLFSLVTLWPNSVKFPAVQSPHVSTLCHSIFKEGSLRLHNPCPPNLSVFNLALPSTPICDLPGFTSSLAKGFINLQTISAVFCTVWEKYLSKKNTAVVILASVCSHSRMGEVGGKK